MIPPLLLIRADADEAIGSGHLIRCGALAHAWTAASGRVAFLTTAPGRALLTAAGWPESSISSVPVAHPDPSDLGLTLRSIGEAQPAWAVTDGYFFTPDYHRAIREGDTSLMIVDDTAHLESYDADMVLNQNAGAEQLAYRAGAGTTLLRGLRYGLVRPEFLAAREVTRAASVGQLRVLVTLGSSDPENLTERVIRAAARAGLRAAITVLVGPYNARGTRLEALARELSRAGQLDFSTMRGTGDIARLMAHSDIAVSAGGSTCIELACVGVATVIIVAADNQRLLAAHLHAQGAALSVGWHQEAGEDRIAATLAAVAANESLRASLGDTARELVDGRGAERVVTAMQAMTASRRAPAADLALESGP